MIKPVNGHLIIEPLARESFISQQSSRYEEIGTVVAVPEIFSELPKEEIPAVGDKVYFDGWLASKYPKEGTSDFFWLVSFEDVRAVEAYGNA